MSRFVMEIDKAKIKAIIDADQIKHSLLLIEDIVEKPFHLKKEWLIQNKWLAVPTESPIYEQEAEWLSEAATKVSCNECLAIPTELQPFDYPFYRVPMTETGILDFAWESGGINYLLIPENKAFAVLKTTEDYSLFAGTIDFVTKAIGSSISTARDMFLRFASDSLWKESERNLLLDVAKKYKSFSAE